MAVNILKDFPSSEEILEWYNINGSNTVHEVNNHFHTPDSFSAFQDVRQIFELALKENIKVLGINDFYTTSGYEEFNDLAIEYKLFPCFNIEFMGLMKEEQKAEIRVNDPSNPGRTYFSGKGLDFPVVLEGGSFKKLENVKKESADQAREMLELASRHLSGINPSLKLDYKSVMKKFTKGMLRERHIAKVIRSIVFDHYKSEPERREIFSKIYQGKECKADLTNNSSIEGEIRSNLLKSGGVAFVKEDSKAFLEIEDIIKIITDAGGIPTYPVLLDDKDGNYTEFESDMEKMFEKLIAMNVASIELIPGRNNHDRLMEFVSYFHDRNFIISFGTEHNTPDLIPLKVDTRGGRDLDAELKRICFEGVCVQAAHQYLRSKEMDGYIDRNGKPRLNQKDEFIELGNAVIEYWLQS